MPSAYVQHACQQLEAAIYVRTRVLRKISPHDVRLAVVWHAAEPAGIICTLQSQLSARRNLPATKNNIHQQYVLLSCVAHSSVPDMGSGPQHQPYVFPLCTHTCTWDGRCHLGYPQHNLERCHTNLGTKPGGCDAPNSILGFSSFHHNLKAMTRYDSPGRVSLTQHSRGLEQTDGLAYHGICSSSWIFFSQGARVYCKEVSLTRSFVSLTPLAFVHSFHLRYGSSKRNVG
jgi:hypothetical protein